MSHLWKYTKGMDTDNPYIGPFAPKGIQLPKVPHASEVTPSATYNGLFWYDNTNNTFQGVANGSAVTIATGAGTTPTADNVYDNGAWTVAVDANDVIFNLATGFNLVINGAAAGTTAQGLVIDDGGGTLTTALLISGSNVVTTAIDVSDAQIATALTCGANDLAGTSWSITGSTGALICVGANYGSGSLVGTGNIAISTSKFQVTGATGATRFLSLTGIDSSDLAIAASATTNQALTLEAGGSGTIGIGLTSTGNITIGHAGIVQIGLVGTTVAITGHETVSGNLTVGGTFTYAGVFIASAGIQLNTAAIAFDADDNSYLQSNANDDIDVYLGGAEEFSFETGRLDFNNNDIEELGHILFVECGAYPAAGTCFIARENDGDLMLNAFTGKNIILGINAAEFAHLDEVGITFAAAAQIDTAAGALTLAPTTDTLAANGTGLVVGHTAQLTGVYSPGDAGAVVPEFEVLGTAAADSSMVVARFSNDAIGPIIGLLKSRGATIDAQGIVNVSDDLGSIVWFGNDGADDQSVAARIHACSDEYNSGGGAAAPGVGDMPTRLVFSTTADAAEVVSECFRINCAQDVKIANNNGIMVGSSTLAPLSVNGAASEFQMLGTAQADSSLMVGRWSNDASGPQIQLVKSRHATIGSCTIPTTGDELGGIIWSPSDDADYGNVAASIIAYADAAGGANDTPARLVFAVAADGGNTGTGRFIIYNNGSMYCGTPPDTSPHAQADSGLVIDQGANDDYAFVLKSSDVATVLTTAVTGADAETDDFLAIAKFAGATGGALISVYGENAAVTSNLVIESYGGQPGVVKTTAGRALVEFYVTQHDGANGLSNITDNGNVFAVRCRRGAADVAVAIVDEDGDVHINGDLDANNGKVYSATSPTFTIGPNYVQAGGAANAITVTITDKAGVNLAETDGMMVLVDLGALTLQAGANTCQLTGAAARSIKTASNPANDIAAKVANAFVLLVYSSTSSAWLVIGE